jgi:hypothetical protein
MELYYDKNACPKISDAVSRYNNDEFDSPLRSTIPLLEFVRQDNLLRKTLADIGASSTTSLHLEYKTMPKSGRGNASHSDLVAVSDETMCVIEAKWTEPKYETVSKWLSRSGDSANRELVLGYWLELLQPYSSRALSKEDVLNITYQTIHRAASACASKTRPIMAYLVFSPSPCAYTVSFSSIKDNLDAFWNIMGRPSSYHMFAIEVRLAATCAFTERLINANDASTSRKTLAEALDDGEPLFDFQDPRIIEIGT